MRFMKRLVATITALASAAAVTTLCLALFGPRPFIVASRSMEPLYTKGSLCLVDTKAEVCDINVGDVLAYRSPADLLVLHRLTSITTTGSDTIDAVMQGDANGTRERIELSRANLIGRAVFTVPGLGTAIGHVPTRNATWLLVALFLLCACLPWDTICKAEGA